MNIVLVGPGRAGHAIRDRAAASGHVARLERDPRMAADADVVLLTVPDRAIAEVAAALPAGQWVGHVSGATPLAALGDSPRRFVLHPAQSMERDGGAAQLDGVSAFTTGADPEAERFAADLATSLGLRVVPIPESMRPLPHIACVIGATFVVTLFATACRLLDRDDAVEILAPLARRALDNAIEAGPAMQPTGPVARGDAPTIAAHLAALERLDPALTPLYLALARATLPIVDEAAAARVEALLETLRTIREVRAALTPARHSERRIALVPTMGAFHDGHVSLMRTARSEAEVVVVSLFVNPSQFGPGEDLARYPRMESDDAARASDIGVDFMFAPSVEEIYPPGFATSIDPGPVARGLWGTARPGHFAGVATVVARLFGIVAPDIAYFGLKDFQQVAVIRRLVADLAMPIEIRALPTIREPDGLAMSSRNRYLNDEERHRARAIFAGLRAAADGYASGERDRRRLVDAARAVMEDAGISVEFVELRDAETLGPYSADRAAVLAVSASVGGTNLIDNVVLAPQITAAPRKIETWSH